MPERSEAVRKDASANKDKCLPAAACLQREEITPESLGDTHESVQVTSSRDDVCIDMILDK